jgi:predicted ATPase/DNA-binding SARP family transcriptional activator
VYVAVLGPVRAYDRDHEIDLGGPRNRGLVARLALEAGRPVAPHTLIDDLWGAHVPGDATNALQSVVSRTRRRLPDGALRSTTSGYVLDAEVDLGQFRRLVAQERTGEALALWRGDALADVRGFPFADRLATGLADERLAAVEQDAARALAGGRPEAPLVAELAGLTREHPHRDGLWLLYLRALAASGRPSEALTEYERLRHHLAEDLGVDPPAELRELHTRILRGELPAQQRRHARLPTALTSFVGRDAAVADVRAALGDHRLVTIMGPGGAGKTRLAVEAARACQDRVGDVWLAELAPLTGDEDLVPTVLSAMGLLEVSVFDRPGATAPRQDPRGRLLDAAADADGLLILDNCEHLVDAVAALAEELLARAAKLRVLATSREALRIIGEFAYQLGPLAVPAEIVEPEEALRYSAVQLFVERARTVDRSFALDGGTLPAVREICLRLDGQPLAIELAAARLRTLDADQVAARLSDRFRLLTGGSRTLPRHRTLRAVVEWSWDLLGDRERDLAERIAVFPGGVTVAGAAAVFDHAEDTAELLESLADKSLLVPVRGELRFRMLETLREYGVERLVERGVAEKVRSTHLDHFLELAEDLALKMRDARQVAAIAALDAERGNLTAALRFAVDRADRPRSARLVRALSWYWMIRNGELEVHTWSEAVLALPGAADPAAEIACRALGITGVLVAKRGDYDWRRLAEEILALWDRHRPDDAFTTLVMAVMEYFGQTGDRVLPPPADAWTRSAVNLMRLVLMENAGRAADCADLIDPTVEGFRACGDGWGLATSLGVRGMLEAYDGHFDRAMATWSEALPLLERLGAEEDAAFTRLRVLSLRLAGADDAGLADLRRTLAAEREAAIRQGNRQRRALTELGLGHLERIGGDYPASVAHLRAVLELSESVESYGGDQFQATVRAALALSVAGCGDLDGARRELAGALEAARNGQDMPVVAYATVALAAFAHGLGDAERAARLLGAATAIRGREDRSNRDATGLAETLRRDLGERYAGLYDAGAGLDRTTALAVLRDAALDLLGGAAPASLRERPITSSLDPSA